MNNKREWELGNDIVARGLGNMVFVEGMIQVEL